MKKQALLTEIKIEKIVDTDPDLSYLEQEDISAYPEDSEYFEKNKERLESYGDSWHMVGVRAVATIHIPMEFPPMNYKIQTIEIGGLWGIESDSADEYFKEVAMQEAEQLQDYLNTLNVNTYGNWELFPGTKNKTITKSFKELLETALNEL